jgi:hypothetical protein
MRWQATIYRLMSMSEKPAEYYSLFPQIYEVNQYHIFKNGRSSYFRCCSLNNLNSPSPKETVIFALFHDFLEWEASGTQSLSKKSWAPCLLHSLLVHTTSSVSSR